MYFHSLVSLLRSTLCPPHPLIRNICSEMKIAALAAASEGERVCSVEEGDTVYPE